MHVAEKIQEILRDRRAALPGILRRLQAVRDLAALGQRTADGVRALADDSSDDEVIEAARQFGAESFASVFADAVAALEVVTTRLQRETINIGVSGQARMGKSTLLQSITGLGEEQIPTGSGLPVTAVRSRIFHVATHPEAILRLHSWASFRRDVLGPYHRELNLREPPATVEEFRRQRYATPAKSDQERPSCVAIRRKLSEIQASLDSFVPWLRDAEERVPIDQLRPFVAYPNAEQQERVDAPRPYLAVRDVRIFTAFPRTPVEHLGLIDLPGLGELTPDAERHHVERLRNEVDLVVLVTRPVEGAAFWKAENARAIDLLDEARGAASRSHFVILAVNDSGESLMLREALLGDIRRQVNEGTDGRNFQVLTCNVSNPEEVHSVLLRRVLEHLAIHLPDMDRAVIQDAEDKLRLAIQRVEKQIALLGRFLRVMPSNARNDVVERAGELQKDLAAALEALVDDLFRAARQLHEDVPFVESVDECMRDALAWIEGGFGKGVDAWQADALKTVLRDKNSMPHASHELNRIRVEISHRFARLDGCLQVRTDQTFEDVAAALDKGFGTVLGEGSGRARLEHFRDLLGRAAEPLPTLEATVDDLLALKFAYRAQIHPRVRQALDMLTLVLTDPATGERHSQVQPAAADMKGMESLFRQLRDLAEQATYATRKGIVVEALLPALVLHAAVEQFTDALLRSADSAREFRLLVAACEDEIWPGLAAGQRQRSAQFGALRKLLRDLERTIDVLSREMMA